jgi:hypothetical protein
MARKKTAGRKRRNRNRNALRRQDGLDCFRPITVEIYDTPIEVKRAEEVRELAERAVDLMSHNDGAGAESLLKQATPPCNAKSIVRQVNRDCLIMNDFLRST